MLYDRPPPIKNYLNTETLKAILAYGFIEKANNNKRAMDLRFKSEINSYYKYLLLGFPVLMFLSFVLIFIVRGFNSTNELFTGLFVVILITGLSFSIYYRTIYIVNNDQLIIRWVGVKKKIFISDITLIRLNQKIVGTSLGASLSFNGIIIYWKGTNSIYISPTQQDKFLSVLREINKDIEIKEGLRGNIKSSTKT